MKSGKVGWSPSVRHRDGANAGTFVGPFNRSDDWPVNSLHAICMCTALSSFLK
jgi:hypothetical protein